MSGCNAQQYSSPTYQDVTITKSLNLMGTKLSSPLTQESITSLGTNPIKTIISDSVSVTSNLNFPSNVTVAFENGGKLVQSGAFTVTFNGAIEASATQVFQGFSPGQVLILKSPSVSVAWFGAKGDGVTDDRIAFNSATGAFGISGGEVQLNCTDKYFITNMIIPSAVHVKGCFSIPDNPGGYNLTSTNYTSVGSIRLSGTVITTTGTTTKGSNVVQVSSSVGLLPGMVFEHPLVQGGSYIVSINGNNVTISSEALATSGAVISDCTANITNTSDFVLMNCNEVEKGIGATATITGTGIPNGTTITGIFDTQNMIIISQNATQTNAAAPVTITNPSSSTIKAYNSIIIGAASGIENTLIFRAGMTFPALDSSAYTSTAIRCGIKADGCYVKDSLIIGFDKGFVSTGTTSWNYANGRVNVYRTKFDTNLGIYISGSADMSRLENIHCWPFATVATNTTEANHRNNSCIKLESNNDATYVDDVLSYSHTELLYLNRTGTILVGTIYADGPTVDGDVGLRTGKNTDNIQVSRIFCFGLDNCVYRDANSIERLFIGQLTSRGTAREAVKLMDGNLTIGQVDIANFGKTTPTAAIWVDKWWSYLTVPSGLVTTFPSGITSVIKSTGQELYTDRIKVNVNTDLAPGDAQIIGSSVHTWPSIAVDAPNWRINLPFNENEFTVTGTNGVSSIIGGNSGRKVRLHFRDGLAVYPGINIAIKGTNVVFPANSWGDFEWNASAGKWVITGTGTDTGDISPVFPEYTFATLPSSPTLGKHVILTDGTSGQNIGSTVTGGVGNSTKYLIWWNGTAWTIIGK